MWKFINVVSEMMIWVYTIPDLCALHTCICICICICICTIPGLCAVHTDRHPQLGRLLAQQVQHHPHQDQDDDGLTIKKCSQQIGIDWRASKNSH